MVSTMRARSLLMLGTLFALASTGAMACSDDGDSGTAPGKGGVGNTSADVQSCVTDTDCPSGNGCYQTDDPADRYCTAICTTNAECRKQLRCPSLATLDERDCRGGKSATGSSLCQVFDGSAGPNACKGGKADPKGPDTNVKSCTNDADCGAGKGCYQTADAADSYCTPLCTDSATCPFQVDCPSLKVFEESDCREKSSEKKGVCQIFDNSLGAKGCASRAPD